VEHIETKLFHHVNNEVGQVTLRQPVPHRRRKQILLVSVVEFVAAAHPISPKERVVISVSFM